MVFVFIIPALTLWALFCFKFQWRLLESGDLIRICWLGLTGCYLRFIVYKRGRGRLKATPFPEGRKVSNSYTFSGRGLCGKDIKTFSYSD